MAEVELRRAVSAGAVVLLHVGLLAAFLFTNYTRMLPGAAHEIEISFPAPSRNQPSPSPAVRPTLISPSVPGAIVPPALGPAPETGSDAPAPGVISGVGRALFGCDPAKLDLLSPEARAACRRLAPRKPPVQSVRMGSPPDPNSPFTREIEERFRDTVPINRPCPLGSYNDIHGLPCFGFEGEGAASPPPHD